MKNLDPFKLYAGFTIGIIVLFPVAWFTMRTFSYQFTRDECLKFARTNNEASLERYLNKDLGYRAAVDYCEYFKN